MFLRRNLGDRFPHSHGTLRPLTFLFCIAGQAFSSRRSARIVFVVLFMNSSTYPAKRHGKRTDTCSLFRVSLFRVIDFLVASFIFSIYHTSLGAVSALRISAVGLQLALAGRVGRFFIWGPVGSGGWRVVPEYLRCLVVFMTSLLGLLPSDRNLGAS